MTHTPQQRANAALLLRLTPSLFLRLEVRARPLTPLPVPSQASTSYQRNDDGHGNGFCPVDGTMAGVRQKDLDDKDQGDATSPDERGNLPRVLSHPGVHAQRMAWLRYRREPGGLPRALRAWIVAWWARLRG